METADISTRFVVYAHAFREGVRYYCPFYRNACCRVRVHTKNDRLETSPCKYFTTGDGQQTSVNLLVILTLAPTDTAVAFARSRSSQYKHIKACCRARSKFRSNCIYFEYNLHAELHSPAEIPRKLWHFWRIISYIFAFVYCVLFYALAWCEFLRLWQELRFRPTTHFTVLQPGRVFERAPCTAPVVHVAVTNNAANLQSNSVKLVCRS